MGLHSYIVNVCGRVVMFYLFVLAGQGQEMGYGSSDGCVPDNMPSRWCPLPDWSVECSLLLFVCQNAEIIIPIYELTCAGRGCVLFELQTKVCEDEDFSITE